MNAPFPERLELIVTAPSWPLMGSRSGSWMQVLLTHELAHYVQLGMERGIFHGLSKIFGNEVRWGSAVFLPGWLIEGPPIAPRDLPHRRGSGQEPVLRSRSTRHP